MNEFEKDNLYHYTNIDTLINHILPNKSLMFNLLGKTNDPFEFSDELNFGGVSSISNNGSELAVKNRQLSEYKERFKLACFSQDRILEDGTVKKGYALNNMWAHYGDNHNGVCIVFNINKLIEKLVKIYKVIYHSPVNYVDEFDGGFTNPLACTDNDIGKTIEEIFDSKKELYLFSKVDDFSNENEYRIAILGSLSNPLFIDIDNCIEMIVLGCVTDIEKKEKLKEYKTLFEVKQLSNHVGKLSIDIPIRCKEGEY